MPVDHCVAKIKRNFGASHVAAQGTLGQSMPGADKESIEQTSLKVSLCGSEKFLFDLTFLRIRLQLGFA